METSLRFDSQTKHLKLFAKEKFSNDDNYVLTVRPPPVEFRPARPAPHRHAALDVQRREPVVGELEGFLTGDAVLHVILRRGVGEAHIHAREERLGEELLADVRAGLHPALDVSKSFRLGLRCFLRSNLAS